MVSYSISQLSGTEEHIDNCIIIASKGYKIPYINYKRKCSDNRAGTQYSNTS